MAEKATILIPDISGYTRFITTTEINHGTHIINELLEEILKANSDTFTIGEIEGDAVLMYKTGDQLSQSELTDHCLKIFEAFHAYIKLIERDRLCHCGACVGVLDLDLKFVAHYGDISIIKVGPFVKASGLDMIIAHRLMKNEVNSDRYILRTQALAESCVEGDMSGSSLNWNKGQESYEAIGNVEYSFTLLDEIKNGIPDPPENLFSDVDYLPNELEVEVAGKPEDIFETFIDPIRKLEWVNNIQGVEDGEGIQRLNRSHICKYDGFAAEIKNINAGLHDDEISFMEKASIPEMGMEFYSLYKIRKAENGNHRIACQLGTEKGVQMPDEAADMLMGMRKADMNSFKTYYESILAS